MIVSTESELSEARLRRHGTNQETPLTSGRFVPRGRSIATSSRGRRPQCFEDFHFAPAIARRFRRWRTCRRWDSRARSGSRGFVQFAYNGVVNCRQEKGPFALRFRNTGNDPAIEFSFCPKHGTFRETPFYHGERRHRVLVKFEINAPWRLASSREPLANCGSISLAVEANFAFSLGVLQRIDRVYGARKQILTPLWVISLFLTFTQTIALYTVSRPPALFKSP